MEKIQFQISRTFDPIVFSEMKEGITSGNGVLRIFEQVSFVL